jgi:hypothetical protein
MSKHKSALNDVATLIDERRQYERWLSAIDERRHSAPPHVLARVQADYEARLERVNERLAAHRGAVDEELTGLRSRLALIDAEIQLRSDERAEVELRAAVGELSAGDVSKALSSVGQTIDTLQLERAEIDANIERLAGFLVVASGGSESGSRSRGESEPSVESFEAPAVPVSESPAAPSGTPELAREPAIEPPAAAAPTPSPAPAPGPTHTPTPTPTPARKSTPFDELGFLSAVVSDASEPPSLPATAGGPRLSGVVRDDPPASSILDPAPGSGERVGGEPPFANNVPANTPIKLRSSGQLEPQKTLKCAECGSMNFPTEWYCERCGAELAAL